MSKNFISFANYIEEAKKASKAAPAQNISDIGGVDTNVETEKKGGKKDDEKDKKASGKEKEDEKEKEEIEDEGGSEDEDESDDEESEDEESEDDAEKSGDDAMDKLKGKSDTLVKVPDVDSKKEKVDVKEDMSLSSNAQQFDAPLGMKTAKKQLGGKTNDYIKKNEREQKTLTMLRNR